MEQVPNEGEIVEPENPPRRSLRLALSELNQSSELQATPSKIVNAEEMLIIQRGPRKKPITWSPVEYDRLKLLQPSRERTPDPNPPNRKPDIHPRLRKRLVMSPEKNPKELGHYIARKLRNLGTFETAGKA